ncbi:DEAD/DEAH box helicase family protein, partial [Streptomyces sp. T-3]|nr:DEAD/DEAH box helicase family protein [Streptomyces sp. T-3]
MTTRPPVRLRPHQRDALDALERSWAQGRRRAWVVLPPGTGKTLTGLEAARRLDLPVVVFGPNTAIQGQWVREWDRFPGAAAGTDRALDARVTVLTYQSLAAFDPDVEVDEDGADAGSHLARLRPGARELVRALRALGPFTLLLDECHHLLDTWGELVAELLRELPEATVIGLTATPPDRLTAAEAELVDELFGPAVRGPSIPAVVREGHLAPFAELAWLTTPTAEESAWLTAEAERFTELTTALLDPAFASTSFLGWLDERVVARRGAGSDGPAVSWQHLERTAPELAAAALRFHHQGLLALPEGARLREEHRHRPTADDWVCLLDDYVRRCLRPSGDARDA